MYLMYVQSTPIGSGTCYTNRFVLKYQRKSIEKVLNLHKLKLTDYSDKFDYSDAN